MPIRRVDNFIDGYRARARACDPHEMSGRGAERRLTEFVNQRIAERLAVAPSDIVVDVGCGDGSLLAALSPTVARGIGVVPTEEEAERLRSHYRARSNLDLVVSRAEQLALPGAVANKVVCNGVLLLLSDHRAVAAALSELYRIAAPGARIWVGEMPDRDEAERARNAYGDSLLRWMLFATRAGAPRAGARTAWTILRAMLSLDPLVIPPKRCTFATLEQMKGLLAAHDWLLHEILPYQPPASGFSPVSRWHYLQKGTS